MSECLDTDAIVTIGDALEWNVADGLRHLQSCEECQTRLDALRLTHAVLTDTEPVDADVLGRISSTLGAAAQGERARTRTRERWARSIEGLLAGITALVILVSSGVQIDSLGAVALAFGLGVALMTAGTVLSRRLSVFSQEETHAGVG